jgi:hypothetical protein
VSLCSFPPFSDSLILGRIFIWHGSVDLGCTLCGSEADVGFVSRLDVYVLNRKWQKGAKPVVVFVHGGVWASGDKWQFSPLGTYLTEQGVVAVLMQYTLYPKVRHLCSSLLLHIGVDTWYFYWCIFFSSHIACSLNGVHLNANPSSC